MKCRIFCFFIISIIFTGCTGVSKGVHDKTLAEYAAIKAGLEKAQDENRRLRDENRQLKNENSQLKGEMDKLSKDVEKVSSERNELAGQAETLKKEKETLAEESQKEAGLLKKDNEELNKKIEALTSERDAALKDKEGLAKQIEALSAEMDAVKGERETLSKEAEKLKGENFELKSTRDALSKNIESIAAERDSALKDKERLAGEAEGLKKEKEAQAEESQKVAILSKKDNEELKEKIAALTSEKDSALKERDELAGKADYLNKEIERLRLKTGEMGSEKEKEVATLKDTYDKLLKEMKGEIERGEINIKQTVDRLSVNMVDRVLFDSGSASVKPDGQKILNRVGAILKGIRDKEIRVDGHTDNKIIGSRIKDKYPTNWELSSARATNVVRYLEDRVGIDPKFLAASGYSKYRPVATNETDEGRAQNRRIEILLLPVDVDKILEKLKSDSK